MTHADAELVEWLRGQIDVWEKSDAGSQECAQAYLHISAKGLSSARLLLAQSAEIARLREALREIVKFDRAERRTCVDFDPAGCTYEVEDIDGPHAACARAALETKG